MAALRGRDIMAKLSKRGLDPQLVAVLVRIGEDHAAIEQSQVQMAAMLNQMINIMNNFGIVAENMKHAVEKLGRKDSAAEAAGIRVESEDVN